MFNITDVYALLLALNLECIALYFRELVPGAKG